MDLKRTDRSVKDQQDAGIKPPPAEAAVGRILVVVPDGSAVEEDPQRDVHDLDLVHRGAQELLEPALSGAADRELERVREQQAISSELGEPVEPVQRLYRSRENVEQRLAQNKDRNHELHDDVVQNNLRSGEDLLVAQLDPLVVVLPPQEAVFALPRLPPYILLLHADVEPNAPESLQAQAGRYTNTEEIINEVVVRDVLAL
mmetsp:Transcript_36440/g.104252  ORF Transcript_36440/g.104252 Transcript_36440/m.104252 type:complete len:202 (-) Transcript_36440:550-1155(-)